MLAETWKIMKHARLRSPDDIDAILPAWKRLASRSLVPAGLNSPELLGPLFKHVGGAELAVVEQDGELLMALPLQRRKFPRGLLSNWVTSLTPLGTPHVDRNTPASAIAELLNSLTVPLAMASIETQGPFWNYLSTRDAHFEIIERWERASLTLDGTYAQWMEHNFNAKRRKEYKRLLSRLGEKGVLEQQTLGANEDASPWIAALLDVEQAGWKGDRGTALANQAELVQATREGLLSLQAAGKLRMWRLVLDGKTIAIMHGVVENGECWLGKIAHDEHYAKYSPGVLLILYATQGLFEEGAIKRADSCAIPGHPMIENIWRDRIEVADVMVAPKSISLAHFKFMVQLERLRRMTRGLARDTYNYLRGRHRS